VGHTWGQGGFLSGTQHKVVCPQVCPPIRDKTACHVSDEKAWSKKLSVPWHANRRSEDLHLCWHRDGNILGG